jgi:ligand-binding sensor domain-containing protein
MPKSAWLAAYATATLAFALDPQRAITQFVHTSWTEKDGAPNNVRALAQTKDGYLWIGTTAGLFRFDGVRFTAFEAPPGEALPATRVRGLLATRDGALWIVWLAGAVSRLQNGHLASYSEQDGLPATSALVESDDGTLIAATSNGLSRLERGRWKDATKEWNYPGKVARQLYFDKNATLWVANENNVMYLRRGQARFVDTGIALRVFYHFVQGPDGAIWVSEVERSAHTIREDDGKRETEVRVDATWVLFDRDGSLWVASSIPRRIPMDTWLRWIAVATRSFSRRGIPARTISCSLIGAGRRAHGLIRTPPEFGEVVVRIEVRRPTQPHAAR